MNKQSNNSSGKNNLIQNISNLTSTMKRTEKKFMNNTSSNNNQNKLSNIITQEIEKLKLNAEKININLKQQVGVNNLLNHQSTNNQKESKNVIHKKTNSIFGNNINGLFNNVNMLNSTSSLNSNILQHSKQQNSINNIPQSQPNNDIPLNIKLFNKLNNANSSKISKRDISTTKNSNLNKITNTSINIPFQAEGFIKIENLILKNNPPLSRKGNRNLTVNNSGNVSLNNTIKLNQTSLNNQLTQHITRGENTNSQISLKNNNVNNNQQNLPNASPKAKPTLYNQYINNNKSLNINAGSISTSIAGNKNYNKLTTSICNNLKSKVKSQYINLNETSNLVKRSRKMKIHEDYSKDNSNFFTEADHFADKNRSYSISNQVSQVVSNIASRILTLNTEESVKNSDLKINEEIRINTQTSNNIFLDDETNNQNNRPEFDIMKQIKEIPKNEEITNTELLATVQLLYNYIKIQETQYNENNLKTFEVINSHLKEKERLRIENEVLHNRLRELNSVFLKIVDTCQQYEHKQLKYENYSNQLFSQLVEENKFLRQICENEITEKIKPAYMISERGSNNNSISIDIDDYNNFNSFTQKLSKTRKNPSTMYSQSPNALFTGNLNRHKRNNSAVNNINPTPNTTTMFQQNPAKKSLRKEIITQQEDPDSIEENPSKENYQQERAQSRNANNKSPYLFYITPRSKTQSN
jgi:hypothetical protein